MAGSSSLLSFFIHHRTVTEQGIYNNPKPEEAVVVCKLANIQQRPLWQEVLIGWVGDGAGPI
jgi:hypothetical protein